MSKEKSFDAIKAMKLENDTSAGNLVDAMPVKVEQVTIDLSFLDNLSVAHPRLLIQSKRSRWLQSEA